MKKLKQVIVKKELEVEREDLMKSPDLDVTATNAKDAYAELKRRTYDDPMIFGYARAARSWTKRGSTEWNVWLEVEALASGSA
jgi:hypothetical protein